MTHHGTETDFELTALERLKALQYRHVFGMDLERPHREVVLKDVLRDSLTRRYPDQLHDHLRSSTPMGLALGSL